MTEQANTPNTQAKPAAPAKKSRRKWYIGGGAAILALGGLAATTAVHADGGWGWRGHGHRGFMMGRTMDPAEMGKRVDFGVDLILGRVQGTDEQKTKVAGIIKGVLGQAPDFRKGNQEAREQLIKILKADTYDKDAVEKLRADRIKAMDEASKKLTAALNEVAATLNAKQRQELVAFAEKRRGMMGGRGHGWRGRH